MAYEFKRLGEVEALNEVPENATVLVEVDGAVKRVPGNGLGGGNTLVITGSDFTNAASGVATLSAPAPEIEYTANMTFTEAFNAFRARKLVNGFIYTSFDGLPVGCACYLVDFTLVCNCDCLCIYINLMGSDITLYWTADGFSTSEPSSGK